MAMNGFLPAMFAEMGARRRRMRAAFGDRGQALVEFLVLGGLAVGSLGLLVREGMVRAAPWGLALPFVFVIGFLIIDARRQARIERGADQDKSSARYDWVVLLWSFGCALLGVAAFVLAWTAQPRVAQQEDWQPPRSAVDVDISP
ncbi:MAG: hypothetical protein JSS00_14680 [Proteobacteria bacterium]|nr:hypothetical protein [Pseudomonadota bacterium]